MSLLVPLMVQLFLPQLPRKLPPTLPSLKPRWFREPISSLLPCLICIYLHSTQVYGRGGGAGEAHPLFLLFSFFFSPFSRIVFIYLNPALLLGGAHSQLGPTGDSVVGDLMQAGSKLKEFSLTIVWVLALVLLPTISLAGSGAA